MSGFTSLKPVFVYKVIGWILFPAAVAYTVITAVKQKNRLYLVQRLGKYRASPPEDPPIWCHCASVGEIKTFLPLLNNLIVENEQLVVSTNTITGFNTLLQANLDNTVAAFLPLDYSFLANNFLKVFSPKILLLAETELWPNILLATARQSKPIIIINGRISDKTFNAPAFMKKSYSRILGHVDHVFASSQTSADRFIALGADRKTVTTIDNLKFSSMDFHEQPQYSRPLKQRYILCASTHAGEESRIMRAWKNHAISEIQLVIAIRHPHRKDDVCNEAEKLGLSYTLHSQGSASNINDIYIIDTLGELPPFIQHAELVFMGGSLVPGIGGHNMLEAACYGKCVVNGPYYDNFTEIVNNMIELDSIIIVENAEHFLSQATTLLNDKKRRIQLGNNARKFLSDKSSVADEYTQWIMNYINPHSS